MNAKRRSILAMAGMLPVYSLVAKSTEALASEAVATETKSERLVLER